MKKNTKKTQQTTLNDLQTSRFILKKAFEIGSAIKAKAVFIYADVCPDVELMDEDKEIFDIYLVAKNKETFKRMKKIVGNVLLVPDIPLTRMGQIKVAVMMAIAQNLLKRGDKIVCLAGIPQFGYLDTIIILEIGREFEMITSKSIIDFSKDFDPKIVEELVRIAVEIANEGREGKPVGTCFIIGDPDEIKKYSHQMILNPFKGYSEEERNILNPKIRETIKEFAQLDGAFIVRKDGVVETAGVFIESEAVPEKLPQGWGARHYSAAAITNITNSLAITISQSTGDVRIFKGGIPIMEIEKPLTSGKNNNHNG